MVLALWAGIVWGTFVGWNASKEVNKNKIQQSSQMTEKGNQ